MSIEKPPQYSPRNDIDSLFPPFPQEVIRRLKADGLLKEGTIEFWDEKEHDIVERNGYELTFLDAPTGSKLRITLYPDGRVCRISQVVNLPTMMAEDIAWFEFYYAADPNGDRSLDLRINPGNVFGQTAGIEGFENLYLEEKIGGNTHKPVKANSEPTLSLYFAGRSNLEVAPGKNNFTNLPNSNKYPASLFDRGEDPWEVNYETTPTGAEFSLTIPGLLEVRGEYRLEVIPNLLQSWREGLHRPIFPFSFRLKRLDE